MVNIYSPTTTRRDKGIHRTQSEQLQGADPVKHLMKRIAAHTREWTLKGHHVLLVGDFNMTENVIKETLDFQHLTVVKPTTSQTTANNRQRKSTTLDHLLASPSLLPHIKEVVNENIKFSDHDAIHIKIWDTIWTQRKPAKRQRRMKDHYHPDWANDVQRTLRQLQTRRTLRTMEQTTPTANELDDTMNTIVKTWQQATRYRHQMTNNRDRRPEWHTAAIRKMKDINNLKRLKSQTHRGREKHKLRKLMPSGELNTENIQAEIRRRTKELYTWYRAQSKEDRKWRKRHREKQKYKKTKSYIDRVLGQTSATGDKPKVLNTANGLIMSKQELESHCIDFYHKYFSTPIPTDIFLKHLQGPEGKPTRRNIATGTTKCPETSTVKPIQHALKAKPKTTEEDIYNNPIRPITKSEWRQYWKGKQKGKSPGLSGITVERCKEALNYRWFDYVRRLINLSLTTGHVFQSWTRELIVPVPKRKFPKHLNEYRPLKMIEAWRKAAEGIIAKRLTSTWDTHDLIDLRQHAYLKGGSTTQPIQTLRALVEDATDYSKPLLIAAMDQSKAYDRIGTWLIEIALRRLNVPEGAIDYICKLQQPECKVETFYGTTETSFKQSRGLSQGSEIAPILWVAIYDILLAHQESIPADHADYPIETGPHSEAYLHVHIYADDVMAMSSSPQRMETRLRQMQSFNDFTGGAFNWTKSELWTCNAPPITAEHTMLNKLKAVHKLKYLGINFPTNEPTQKLRDKVKHVAQCLESANISAEGARLIEQISIRPAVLYEAQFANWTKQETDHLEGPIRRAVLHKHRLPRTFPKLIYYAPRETGGLGFIPWHDEAAISKLMHHVTGLRASHETANHAMLTRLQHWVVSSHPVWKMSFTQDIGSNGSQLCETWKWAYENHVSINTNKGITEAPQDPNDRLLAELPILGDRHSGPRAHDLIWTSDIIDGNYLRRELHAALRQHPNPETRNWWSSITEELCSNPRTGSIKIRYRINKQCNRIRIGQMIETRSGAIGEIQGIQDSQVRVQAYNRKAPSCPSPSSPRKGPSRCQRLEHLHIQPTDRQVWEYPDNIKRELFVKENSDHHIAIVTTSVPQTPFRLIPTPPETTRATPSQATPSTMGTRPRNTITLTSQTAVQIEAGNQVAFFTTRLMQGDKTIRQKTYKYENPCHKDLHAHRVDLVATHQSLRSITRLGLKYKHHQVIVTHYAGDKHTSHKLDKFHSLSTLQQVRTPNEDVLREIHSELRKASQLGIKINISGHTPEHLPSLTAPTTETPYVYKESGAEEVLLHGNKRMVHDPRKQLKQTQREKYWSSYRTQHPFWTTWIEKADLQTWSKIWQDRKSKHWLRFVWIEPPTPAVLGARQGAEPNRCLACNQEETTPNLTHILKNCTVTAGIRNTFYQDIEGIDATRKQRLDAHSLDRQKICNLVNHEQHPTQGPETAKLIRACYLAMHDMWKHYHAICHDKCQDEKDLETIQSEDTNIEPSQNTTNYTEDN